MKKLIILKGLPASGKSTYAKKLVDENNGAYKRINKDELRIMLDNGKWSKDNEKFVLKTRDQLILSALAEGKHVIVDDTNLHPKHLAHLTQLVKGLAKVEIVEFNVDPEECIKRDLARPNSVGSDVIWDMYNKFLKPEVKVIQQDETLPKAIIVDIDGTLAHRKDRSPFDWARVGEDDLDEYVAWLVTQHYNFGYRVILVSGRDGICRKKTEGWLERHGVPYNELHMRPEGDNRKDSIIKLEIYENEIKGKYSVECVYDDRDQVVKMWREQGLRVFQVAEGDF